MNDMILCVDDEEKVLKGITRQLSDDFEIDTATSGQEGLERIAESGPYAVVVSDMRMPGMNGIEFLKQVREQSPDTTRMLLTGFSELQTTIAAINEGHIFRFLAKPCPADTLSDALSAGIHQYRLVTAEKELIENTLKGSVKVLSEVLSLASPVAFGRASRIKTFVQEIAVLMDMDDLWQIEIATMLSQLGCVTVPEETLQRAYRGDVLSAEEDSILAKYPSVGRDLLKHIPRMEAVAEIIAYQTKGYDGSGFPNDELAGDKIPLGARILKVALDFDAHGTSGLPPLDALKSLKACSQHYDPSVLNAAQQILQSRSDVSVAERKLTELRLGMVFADDVKSQDGQLLVTKGQEISSSILQRLRNFQTKVGIREPISVFVESTIQHQTNNCEI